ncbi:hypothetical protein GZH53_12310 [Flavihumibacter sp. R14]|nr:hypothetical protein [Flavihumibacter soli]
MKSKIENIDDLRSEILRLKLQRFHHEALIEQHVHRLKDKFRIPSILLNKVNTWFGDNARGVDKSSNDWVTNAFRIGLPVALNKLVFGKSGFIMKSLVTLLSQKAATSFNKDSITSWIDTASSWIRGAAKSRRSRSANSDDYGIPPDSETY